MFLHSPHLRMKSSIPFPSRYKVEEVKTLEGSSIEPIEEIVSFRGRFCDQARNGEFVIAQGKVERLKEGNCEKLRLLLGKQVSDYMILA